MRERERKRNRIERRENRSEAYEANESAYTRRHPTPPRGTLNAAASQSFLRFLVVSRLASRFLWFDFSRRPFRRIPGISVRYIVTRRVRASSVYPPARPGGSLLPSGFSFLTYTVFLSLHFSLSLSFARSLIGLRYISQPPGSSRAVPLVRAPVHAAGSDTHDHQPVRAYT